MRSVAVGSYRKGDSGCLRIYVAEMDDMRTAGSWSVQSRPALASMRNHMTAVLSNHGETNSQTNAKSGPRQLGTLVRNGRLSSSPSLLPCIYTVQPYLTFAQDFLVYTRTQFDSKTVDPSTPTLGSHQRERVLTY
jgi:fatty acid-binding protein DegV